MSPDVAIVVAPNGARRTKEDHPRLPVTAAEIGATAASCREAGAGGIHLHVRDTAGRHALDAGAYRAAIAAIRERAGADMAIQVTTEAAGIFSLAEQIAMVRDLRPAGISFAVRELMREGDEAADTFLRWASGQGVGIQFILYDPEDIARFAALWRSGRLYLAGRPSVIVVVGRYAEAQNSKPEEFDRLYLALVAERLDEAADWMTCAFGSGELACLERAIERGGHVRVGFENAIVDSRGRPARDNAERVALVADLAASHGRAIASAEKTASLLGMHSLDALL